MGNDHWPEKLWSLHKFSLSLPKKMHKKEFGEFGYWYWGVKDYWKNSYKSAEL